MLARLKSSRFFFFLSRVPWLSQALFPLLIVLPVLGFYLIKPRVFEWMWVGYAALVYATFFVILTWLHYRMVSKEKKVETRVAWVGVILFLAGISIYQLLLYGTELPQLIYQTGAALGLRDAPTPALSHNWVTSVDFIIFTAYMVGLITSFFGIKSLKFFLGPIIYSVSIIGAFLADAAYPFTEFAIFQWWVPAIVFIAAHLLRAFGVNVTYGKDFLYSPRLKPPMIGIAWPCAGIHSLLIYTAVAYSFLQNLEISRIRKLLYVSLGFLGTYMVNILRITTIILANYYFNVDIYVIHYYAGELFFIVWIVIFLFLLVMIERRRKPKQRSATPI